MVVKKLKESTARFCDLVREGPDAVGEVSKPMEIAAEIVSLLGLLLNVAAGAALALFSRRRRGKVRDRSHSSLRNPKQTNRARA